MENHKIYEQQYEVWKKVYAAQLDLCKQGLTKNMWKAPGV